MIIEETGLELSFPFLSSFSDYSSGTYEYEVRFAVTIFPRCAVYSLSLCTALKGGGWLVERTDVEKKRMMVLNEWRRRLGRTLLISRCLSDIACIDVYCLLGHSRMT